jgi:hypothetical protein
MAVFYRLVYFLNANPSFTMYPFAGYAVPGPRQTINRAPVIWCQSSALASGGG